MIMGEKAAAPPQRGERRAAHMPAGRQRAWAPAASPQNQFSNRRQAKIMTREVMEHIYRIPVPLPGCLYQKIKALLPPVKPQPVIIINVLQSRFHIVTEKFSHATSPSAAAGGI